MAEQPSGACMATVDARATGARRPVRLLTISHSYVVALNRRLASSVAEASNGRYDVTVVAPEFFHGDLRPIPLERRADETHISLIPIPVFGSKHAQVFVYGTRLKGVLRRGWDLVHCWEEPYVLSGAQIAHWTAASTPLVYATFQNIAKQYPPPFGYLERRSLRRASGLISFGHTVAEVQTARIDAARSGHPRTFVHDVVPLGVDTAMFSPDPLARAEIRGSLGLSDTDGPVVLYMGRFVPEKGLAVLMAALTAVAQARVAHQVVMLGGGPMEASLRTWASAHPHPVRILTSVGHDDVPRHLRAGDILVAPSETRPNWREQLGRMLLEGFASGLAVIGSDSGEIPHVIGDAGVVVPEGDVPAWTAAIQQLLTNTERRSDLSRRGRARAESVYAWDRVGRRLVDVFDDVLAVSRAHAGSARR